MDSVDLIVIGSGQGGVPLAAHYGRQGKRVVVFERSRWGGSCVNYACTPTKALLASAHLAGAGRHAEGMGVHVSAQPDTRRVMERVRGTVESGSRRVRSRLEAAGVRLIEAEASFSGVRRVRGGGMEFEAPIIVIDVGKSPRVPDIEGLAGTPYRTYASLWEMDAVPERSIIAGAGYTGVEIGQALARLGSHVHLVEIEDRPIPAEEVDVSRAVGAALYDDGVEFHLSTRVRRVSHREGVFDVELGSGRALRGEMLLLAVGRRPNTAALNAGASHIDLDDEGNIRVDDRLQTTCEGVYAIGDATGQQEFTHVAWEDYRRLRSILEGGDRRRGDRPLCYGFFTDPQVGRAGLTLEEARARGRNARAATLPLEDVARASQSGRTDGFYRLVVDAETDEILGATLVGEGAAELVHVVLAFMYMKGTWRDLADGMFIHPTYAEGLPTLARRAGRELRAREAGAT